MIQYYLPTINATLNGLAALFLLLGWFAIRRKDQRLHQQLMISALVCSAAFLSCYLTYHFLIHGVVTRYQGEGLSRIFYFAILLTHTPLAMLIVPFALMAFWHAYRQEFDKHTRITRWLLPVWMYVSITGVLIYLMLYAWS
ncbi:MAG: DUF420 domain-containing protein [Candidatus Omnitrophica bacterium]|nr:DUF420 domain-containing protein [Candidatus Omnitrophota bacterium]